MKTLVKFKALVPTRVRDENGNKIAVKKDREFTTTDAYATNYRKYKRMFEEVEIVNVKPKKDKTTAKNSNAFPVAISEETTNKEIEAMLEEMGAKYKKKGKRSDLIKSYEDRLVEMDEEKLAEIQVEATETFKSMVDNRNIDQLQEMAEDMDKALDVKNIDKEACEEYIIDTLAKKVEEADAKKEGDDEGNSEGTLEGADAGEGAKEEGSEGSEEGEEK